MNNIVNVLVEDNKQEQRVYIPTFSKTILGLSDRTIFNVEYLDDVIKFFPKYHLSDCRKVSSIIFRGSNIIALNALEYDLLDLGNRDLYMIKTDYGFMLTNIAFDESYKSVKCLGVKDDFIFSIDYISNERVKFICEVSSFIKDNVDYNCIKFYMMDNNNKYLYRKNNRFSVLISTYILDKFKKENYVTINVLDDHFEIIK